MAIGHPRTSPALSDKSLAGAPASCREAQRPPDRSCPRAMAQSRLARPSQARPVPTQRTVPPRAGTGCTGAEAVMVP